MRASESFFTIWVFTVNTINDPIADKTDIVQAIPRNQCVTPVPVAVIKIVVTSPKNGPVLKMKHHIASHDNLTGKVYTFLKTDRTSAPKGTRVDGVLNLVSDRHVLVWPDGDNRGMPLLGFARAKTGATKQYVKENLKRCYFCHKDLSCHFFAAQIYELFLSNSQIYSCHLNFSETAKIGAILVNMVVPHRLIYFYNCVKENQY